jgi:hypothetical protein
MAVCPICGKDEMFHVCPKLDSSFDKSFDALDSASPTFGADSAKPKRGFWASLKLALDIVLEVSDYSGAIRS